MVKLHPFPSYQPLTLDLACLSVIPPVILFFLPLQLKFYYGMKLKLTPALVLDKRSSLITSST